MCRYWDLVLAVVCLAYFVFVMYLTFGPILPFGSLKGFYYRTMDSEHSRKNIQVGVWWMVDGGGGWWMVDGGCVVPAVLSDVSLFLFLFHPCSHMQGKLGERESLLQ